jgi:exonuclease V gamma subunit
MNLSLIETVAFPQPLLPYSALGMNTKLLFSSHNLESLVDALLLHLDRNIFSRPLIVIPSVSMKEWLQIELCKRAEKEAFLGLEFALWPQAVHKLAPKLPVPGKADLLAASWDALEEKSVDRALHQLHLLSEWSLYGPKESPFKTLFECHGWLPLFQALDGLIPKAHRPLFLFGLDSLPPEIYRFFLRHPSVKVFRFSPCAMFWEDVRSSSERRFILKKWSGQASLEELLNNTHPLLANWGVAGRQILLLDEALETDENYDTDESATVLQQIKLDFLTLEKPTEKRATADSSIRLLKAGSSPLSEVEIVRDAMIEHRKQGILFEEMRIYAPDIEPYGPLIEFVCSHPDLPIPVRIETREQYRKSPFYQALTGLFECAHGYWNCQDLLALFESKAFAHWKMDLEKLKKWTTQAHIRWGFDQEHRKELNAKATNGTGSWQDGFNALIDSLIYLKSEETTFLPWSDTDLLERFLETFERLRKTLVSWKEPRSLAHWAEAIEALASEFLFLDETSEVDRSMQKSYLRFLETLRAAASSSPVPFALVKTLFNPERIEEKPGLHSVRCSSLEKGAILPAKIVFLIGMDEESFPRVSSISSAEVEKLPNSLWDRYLFLQALFAAKAKLVISYRDRSEEDGKPVSPSLIVEELLGYIEESFIDPLRGSHHTASPIAQVTQESRLLQKIETPPPNVTLHNLNRFFRHPLRYYLEENLHLTLPKELASSWEEFECSPLLTHQLLQQFLEASEVETTHFPLGLFGEEAKSNLEEKKEQFQEAFNKWGIDPGQIHSVEFNLLSISGTGHLAVPQGALHMGEDSIRGMLRRWPEILAVLCHTGSNKIYSLRTSRVREVNDPLGSLQKLRELFLQLHSSPLFFHPDWADDLLRKERDPEEESEDLVLRWVLERTQGLEVSVEWQKTRDLLKGAFDSLTALFPVRGAHAKV